MMIPEIQESGMAVGFLTSRSYFMGRFTKEGAEAYNRYFGLAPETKGFVLAGDACTFTLVIFARIFGDALKNTSFVPIQNDQLWFCNPDNSEAE